MSTVAKQSTQSRIRPSTLQAYVRAHAARMSNQPMLASHDSAESFWGPEEWYIDSEKSYLQEMAELKEDGEELFEAKRYWKTAKRGLETPKNIRRLAKALDYSLFLQGRDPKGRFLPKPKNGLLLNTPKMYRKLIKTFPERLSGQVLNSRFAEHLGVRRKVRPAIKAMRTLTRTPAKTLRDLQKSQPLLRAAQSAAKTKLSSSRGAFSALQAQFGKDFGEALASIAKRGGEGKKLVKDLVPLAKDLSKAGVELFGEVKKVKTLGAKALLQSAMIKFVRIFQRMRVLLWRLKRLPVLGKALRLGKFFKILDILLNFLEVGLYLYDCMVGHQKFSMIRFGEILVITSVKYFAAILILVLHLVGFLFALFIATIPGLNKVGLSLCGSIFSSYLNKSIAADRFLEGWVPQFLTFLREGIPTAAFEVVQLLHDPMGNEYVRKAAKKVQKTVDRYGQRAADFVVNNSVGDWASSKLLRFAGMLGY